MPSISELRELVQAPRKSMDTWYGRFVMRRFSIYLTWASQKLGLTPNQISLISLFAAIVSAVSAIYYGSLGSCILWMNLWYLIDHVDGELARFTKRSSVTGYYFDTILNFIVQPLFFMSLGVWLSGNGVSQAPFWAAIASYGSLMLMILPMTEDAVLLSIYRKKGHIFQPENQPAGGAQKSTAKKILVLVNRSILFPTVLLTTTALYLVLLIFPQNVVPVFSGYLIIYAIISTFFWMAKLAVQIFFSKLESKARL